MTEPVARPASVCLPFLSASAVRAAPLSHSDPAMTLPPTKCWVSAGAIGFDIRALLIAIDSQIADALGGPGLNIALTQSGRRGGGTNPEEHSGLRHHGSLGSGSINSAKRSNLAAASACDRGDLSGAHTEIACLVAALCARHFSAVCPFA